MIYDTADTNEHDGATGGSKTKHTEHRTQNMERRGRDNMQTINTWQETTYKWGIIEETKPEWNSTKS